ncbi:uncharacterized protein LOC134719592 [Mytilus trossulus]|uniref:uncharacterized protein LOC134719592 n=1 Tax=Mytilus trossulus TaxID=6551 RepID=UPI0030040F0C
MYAHIALTAGVLATILIITGTFTPFWTVISGSVWSQSIDSSWTNNSMTSLGLGLWFQQMCTTDGCVTSFYPSDMYNVHVMDMTGLTEFRMYTSCGILLSISACILCFLHIKEKSPKLTGFASSLMFLFSGIMIWLPAGKMIHRYVLFDTNLDEVGIPDNPLQFPYSAIICGVGGIMNGFCIFLVAGSVRKMWNYTSEFRHKRLELNTFVQL